MTLNRRWVLAGALVALSLAASIYAFPRLPDPMVTHWNAAGQPDGFMSKTVGTFLLPAILAGLLVLFAVIPRIDPLGENIRSFGRTYEWFIVLIVGFLTYVHLLSLGWNLGFTVDVSLALALPIGALMYGVSVLIGRTERNWFVGIRTPWTLSSDEVWARTHRVGALLFKAMGVVTTVGLLLTDNVVLTVVVPLVAVAVFTVGYSYYVYRQVEGRGDAVPQ